MTFLTFIARSQGSLENSCCLMTWMENNDLACKIPKYIFMSSTHYQLCRSSCCVSFPICVVLCNMLRVTTNGQQLYVFNNKDNYDLIMIKNDEQK